MNEQIDLLLMNKDQLEGYAQKQFGIDIDKRKKISQLREEVEAMGTDKEVPVEMVDEDNGQIIVRLRNPDTGLEFEPTALLLEKDGLVPVYGDR